MLSFMTDYISFFKCSLRPYFILATAKRCAIIASIFIGMVIALAVLYGLSTVYIGKHTSGNHSIIEIFLTKYSKTYLN